MSFGFISLVFFCFECIGKSMYAINHLWSYTKTGKTPFVLVWFENATVFYFNEFDLHAFCSRSVFISCSHFPISYQFSYRCNEKGMETPVPSNACLTKMDCNYCLCLYCSSNFTPKVIIFTLTFTTTYCSQSDCGIILYACTPTECPMQWKCINVVNFHPPIRCQYMHSLEAKKLTCLIIHVYQHTHIWSSY